MNNDDQDEFEFETRTSFKRKTVKKTDSHTDNEHKS